MSKVTKIGKEGLKLNLIYVLQEYQQLDMELLFILIQKKGYN